MSVRVIYMYLGCDIEKKSLCKDSFLSKTVRAYQLFVHIILYILHISIKYYITVYYINYNN